MGMRTRVTALAAVVAFALAVATVAVLAGRDGGQDLIKLPLGSASFASDGAATTMESRRAMLAPGFGAVEYEVAGTLPELASTAPAYRLGSTASEDDVRTLGRALGLDGDVRQDGARAWVLTDGDLELRVERVPGLPWYLATSCPEPAVGSDGAPDAAVASCEGVAVATQVAGIDPARPVCEDGAVCSVPPSPAVALAPAPVPSPTPSATTFTAVGEAVARPQAATAVCADPVKCAEPAPLPPDGPPPTLAPVPPPAPPPRPADLPSRTEAEGLARALFERLGAGTEGFEMQEGWATWEAWVEPRLDGFRVYGTSHSVSIGSKGAVVRANGFLGRPERIGDYPLVGVEEALERLRNPTASGGVGFVADGVAVLDSASSGGSAGAAISPEEGAKLEAGGGGTEPAIGDCGDPAVSCVPPPDLAAEPPEPIVQTVTGVHLALLQIDAVLAPVYVFELEGGGETFPVPAVTDEWLDRQVPAPAKLD